MVPGHEIAGIVEAVGASVTKYKVGDRVGVGCFVDSCRSCSSCKDGFEQYCTGEVPSRDSELALDLKVGKHGTYNACVGDDIAKAKVLLSWRARAHARTHARTRPCVLARNSTTP